MKFLLDRRPEARSESILWANRGEESAESLEGSQVAAEALDTVDGADPPGLDDARTVMWLALSGLVTILSFAGAVAIGREVIPPSARAWWSRLAPATTVHSANSARITTIAAMPAIRDLRPLLRPTPNSSSASIGSSHGGGTTGHTSQGSSSGAASSLRRSGAPSSGGGASSSGSGG
jgi:hypothetical protein